MGAGTPSTRFWNPYAQWGSEHHFINDYVWLQLWYGDQWGDDRLPELPGGWGQGAAQSWDEIEPSRVYDFHIHPDLVWHDGAPVVADDVVWSYQMAIDPAYGAKFADITYINIQGSQAWAENPTDNVEDSGGVVAIDNKTVRVSLSNPNPGWWGRPLKDRSIHLPPYPKHLYKDIDPATAFEGHPLAAAPVGNGALKAVRYVEGQFWELEANNDFAYGAPYIDRYIVRYGDRDANDAAMEAGELDHIRAGSVESFVRLGEQAHLQAFPQRSPFGSVIWLQRGSEIFKDTNISLLVEAMVLALDRDTVNATLDRGTRFKTDYVWAHVGLIADPPPGTYRELPYNPDERPASSSPSLVSTPVRRFRFIKWGNPGPRDVALPAVLGGRGAQCRVPSRSTSRRSSRSSTRSARTTGTSSCTTWAVSTRLEDGWQRVKCGWVLRRQAGFNARRTSATPSHGRAVREGATRPPTPRTLQEALVRDCEAYIHGRGTMVAGPHVVRHRCATSTTAACRDRSGSTPTRSPCGHWSRRTWIDPRWDGTDFSG